jgi:hypothetical protein
MSSSVSWIKLFKVDFPVLLEGNYIVSFSMIDLMDQHVSGKHHTIKNSHGGHNINSDRTETLKESQTGEVRRKQGTA